jgi:hypothetical protein
MGTNRVSIAACLACGLLSAFPAASAAPAAAEIDAPPLKPYVAKAVLDSHRR